MLGEGSLLAYASLEGREHRAKARALVLALPGPSRTCRACGVLFSRRRPSAGRFIARAIVAIASIRPSSRDSPGRGEGHPAFTPTAERAAEVSSKWHEIANGQPGTDCDVVHWRHSDTLAVRRGNRRHVQAARAAGRAVAVPKTRRLCRQQKTQRPPVPDARRSGACQSGKPFQRPEQNGTGQPNRERLLTVIGRLNRVPQTQRR